MNFKQAICLTLCAPVFASTTFAASDGGYNVKYDGGSTPGIKVGDEVRLYIDQKQIRYSKDKKDVLTISAASVTEINYGQDVHRRIGTAIGLAVISLGVGALMALSKSKKHFIGLTWADGDTKGGLAMQCDKNEYRGILTGLEGITGKKAVDTDALTVKN